MKKVTKTKSTTQQKVAPFVAPEIYKIKPKARHRARRFAMQAIYQWQITGNDIADIEAQFLVKQDMQIADVAYFRDLLHGVPAKLDTIDEQMTPFLDRPLAEVDPIELAILRIGIYELMYRKDIPYRVAINEAVEVAKQFGGEDGHKYVNGILDRIVKK